MHLYMLITLQFSQEFWNQWKNLSYFYTKIQIFEEKVLDHIITFWNFEVKFARNGHTILKNVFYESVSELIFTPRQYTRETLSIS